MGYFRFFSHTGPDFFPPCTKNLLDYYSLKVTKFHGDSSKNENSRTKKLQGGRKTPPPAFLGLTTHFVI